MTQKSRIPQAAVRAAWFRAACGHRWILRGVWPVFILIVGLQVFSHASSTAQVTTSGRSEHHASARRAVDGSMVKPHHLPTGSLLPDGTLFVANSNAIVPWDALRRLKEHGWSGGDYDAELRPLIAIPAQRALSLIYSTGGSWSRVASIDNLWLKVRIESEEDAASFFDLIGGPLTKPFFADARGWELRRKSEGWRPPGMCVLEDSRFDALGLHDRRIERVHGGFIVRRTMYMDAVSCLAGSAPYKWPRARQNPQQIVQAREFVSTEGFYLFGIDRVVCKGDDCPLIVLPERDSMAFEYAEKP